MRHNILKIAYSLLAVVGMLAFSACSNDDDYQPGAPVAQGVVGAFFDKSNTTDFSLEDEGATNITIKVNRVDTTEAVSVPLKVKCDTSAIVIPNEVSFEKGEKQAELVIAIDEGLYLDKNYNFSIDIDSASINPYAAGVVSYSGSVFKGNPWKVVAKDAKFYFDDSSCPLPTMYSDICQYKNENRFRINNFMGSHTDLEFSLTSGFDATDIDKCEGHFAWNTDQVYNYNGYDYIFATDSNGEYSYSWKIDGCDVGIKQFAGYMGAYSYIVFNKQDNEKSDRNYLSFYGFCDLDNGNAINAYFYGVW